MTTFIHIPPLAYTKKGSLKQLRDLFDRQGLGIGWNESFTDTVLITRAEIGLYKAWVWNETGIRMEIAKVLGLPVRTPRPPVVTPETREARIEDLKARVRDMEEALAFELEGEGIDVKGLLKRIPE